MWGFKDRHTKIQIPWIWNSVLWMSQDQVIGPLPEITELLRFQIQYQQENSIHVNHHLVKHWMSFTSSVQRQWYSNKSKMELWVFSLSWVRTSKTKLSTSGWDMSHSCLRFILLFILMMMKETSSDQTKTSVNIEIFPLRRLIPI